MRLKKACDVAALTLTLACLYYLAGHLGEITAMIF